MAMVENVRGLKVSSAARRYLIVAAYELMVVEGREEAIQYCLSVPFLQTGMKGLDTYFGV